MIRFPDTPRRLGLGVGLDLPWGAPIGFEYAAGQGDRVTDKVARFLDRHASTFTYGFVSWQPRDRSVVDLVDYAPAFDDLFSRTPAWSVRALHHTALNLGATEPYERGRLLDFTNALVQRYRLRWVNEDLGLWSIRGRPLPYPLPPYLTEAGLAACIRNTAEVQRGLDVPLLVEFPGFSEGVSFTIGELDAYDFFRHVVEETDSACTLDTGHLLSWQWQRGRRGDELFEELERLPLEHCFEIHLSGCDIIDDRFMDYHHGVIHDAQLQMLDHLLARCPNARAVTYEDPKFDAHGRLIAKSVPNFERLQVMVQSWASA